MNNNFKYNKTTGKFDAPKSVTEAKQEFNARGLNTNIRIQGLPNPESNEKIGMKVYEALIKLMKKEGISPNEIIFKF
jgi:hypothetical protein|tara:strand:+ start:413 stop:643 length:231 start_codon:yes stop_codon:yes gene_type:complete